MKRAELLLALAACLAAAPSAAQDAALLKDLGAALRLLDLPCGEVISAQRRAENDHVATCKNGMRYRVFVSAEGRVVAQKQ
jgi:hypothetical protein